jgi:hypothetical protein
MWRNGFFNERELVVEKRQCASEKRLDCGGSGIKPEPIHLGVTQRAELDANQDIMTISPLQRFLNATY